jgi:DNA-binding MurR/RpiR family transcriptional regulator
MNTPITSTPELIAAVADRLTPTERLISEAVLGEPTLLAFGTVADLAERVGTSGPSIVRFATKLGFAGYSDLQDYVRHGMSHELAKPSERIRAESDTPETVALGSALESVFALVDSGRIAALAHPIGSARTVWVLSGETSRAGGHALCSGLGMLRSDVRMVDDRSMGSDLADALPQDVAVVFDFYRYRAATFAAAKTLSGLGCSLVAVTDGPLSPLAALTDMWCEVTVPAVGPFDSSVPAVAVAELLVAQVAKDLHDEATQRIDRTEALWDATGTFL